MQDHEAEPEPEKILTDLHQYFGKEDVKRRDDAVVQYG